MLAHKTHLKNLLQIPKRSAAGVDGQRNGATAGGRLTNCRCCCVCGLVDDVLEQLRMVAVRVVAAHDLASFSSPLALSGCPACALDRV